MPSPKKITELTRTDIIDSLLLDKEQPFHVWPTHERRSAFERAIEAKEEYILPARFDDTMIPGLHKTIKYVDLRTKTPDELASLILKKLGRLQPEPETSSEGIADEGIPF